MTAQTHGSLLPRVDLLGYPVDCLSLSDVLHQIDQSTEPNHTARQQPAQIVTLNPEMLMQGERNPQLARILKSADWVIPDGAGVVWALQFLYGIKTSRLPGIELSEALLQKASDQDWPVAIIGAESSVLTAAIGNLTARYSGLKTVYHHHGFFAPGDESLSVAKACAETNPKLVFVALGVPRQETWIEEYKSMFLPSTVMIGIGGSLDVWSGIKKRAPRFFLMLNLEWLYRITSEPWRLKRIYNTLPVFVVKVCLKRLGF